MMVLGHYVPSTGRWVIRVGVFPPFHFYSFLPSLLFFRFFLLVLASGEAQGRGSSELSGERGVEKGKSSILRVCRRPGKWVSTSFSTSSSFYFFSFPMFAVVVSGEVSVGSNGKKTSIEN